MKLSDLAVGSLVVDIMTSYNDYPIIWRVLEHGHAGDPEGSTTLDVKDIIMFKCFDAEEPNSPQTNRRNEGNNRYRYSNILQWLNSDKLANQWYTPQHTYDQAPDLEHISSQGVRTGYVEENGFLTNFSDYLKGLLMTASKPTEISHADGSGIEYVESKVWLLSCTEVGTTKDSSTATEGSIYKYYSDSDWSARQKIILNEATRNGSSYGTVGSNWIYWTRSCDITDSTGYNMVSVFTNGMYDAASGSNRGVGFAICIPSSIEVSSSVDEYGAYEIVRPITNNVEKIYAVENGVTKLIYG